MHDQRHRHVWRATLYDGRWVEYCELCPATRTARLNRWGTPVAMPRVSKDYRVERIGLGTEGER